MKKVFIALFIVPLIFIPLVSATNASVVTIDPEGNTQTIPFTISYPEESGTGTIYSIDISWGSLDFTYHDGSQRTWNPDKLKYEGTGSSGWTYSNASSPNGLAGNQIKISNRSNAPILCYPSISMVDSDIPITGTLTFADTLDDVSTAFSLETAVGASSPDAPPSRTMNLTISGTPPSTYFGSKGDPLGNICIVIGEG